MTSKESWPHESVNNARAEHGYLQALLEETRRALQPSTNPEQARSALAHLIEALTKHLDQEEKIYFPPLRALRPEHKAALRNFQLTHEHLRNQMQEVENRFRSDALVEAADAFEQLSASFNAHEQEEEKLFRALARETKKL